MIETDIFCLLMRVYFVIGVLFRFLNEFEVILVVLVVVGVVVMFRLM